MKYNNNNYNINRFPATKTATAGARHNILRVFAVAVVVVVVVEKTIEYVRNIIRYYIIIDTQSSFTFLQSVVYNMLLIRTQQNMITFTAVHNKL